jgi:signal transduction histidine kinase
MEHERSEWLSVIAGFTRHELKNAMAGIGSSLELLERLALSANGAEYVDRAKRSLHFMRSILTQVANATSLESALELQELEDVDLSRLVAGRGDDLHREDNAHRCELVVTDGVHVLGNADSLLQMLDKLLNNALEHSGPGDLIRVSLEASNGRALLTVLNHGDPLPADNESLFRPFVSAGPATREDNLGLGLYVAQTIARRHQGTIRAEPTADRPGAVFVVDLPLLSSLAHSTYGLTHR